jgi:hypothetical protein
MAGANINVSATLRFNSGYGVQQQGLTPSPNYTQVGSHAVSSVQDITTAAETLAIGDCANLKYACVYNPSDSGVTITVTCAPQTLLPGDAILLRPSSTAVTLQATAAVSPLTAMAEA